MRTRYLLILPAFALLATSCLKTDSQTDAEVTARWAGTVTLEQTSNYVDAFANNTRSTHLANNMLQARASIHS